MKQDLNIYKRLDDLPDFFPVHNFSELFGISRATAYRMANQGTIPCLKIGKRIIMSREHLKQWVDTMMEVR